jgi:diguanylate cyclase (GGDEF)-like protein
MELWRGIQAWRGSLRLHVIVSVVSLLLPVFILAGVGYLLVRPMVTEFESVSTENLEEFSALVNMQSALLETSTAVHDYLVTRDAPTRDKFHRVLAVADIAMQRLQTAPFSETERVSLPAIAEAWQQIHAVTAVLVDPRHPLTKTQQSHANERYHDLATGVEQSMDSVHGLLRAEVIGELRAANENKDNLLTTAGWTVLIACCVSAVATASLSRVVLRPLGRLQDAARRFGMGDLTHRVVVERRDELGELAETFNIMAHKIERNQQTLTDQATHDGLTGLVNRVLFRDRLEHALARAKRQQTSVAVMVLDLDGFKRVNDTLGHSAGDDLLIEIGRRLKSVLRESDTAGRLGGDEFAILIEELQNLDDARHVADRIMATLRPPVILDNKEMTVLGSMGVAVSDPGQTSEDLLRNADLAMYAAKDKGKGRVAVFEAGMYNTAMQRISLEEELRRAVANEEFVLHYQPVIELATNNITGLEALVRWQHPQRGLVPPAEFIPIAEETGLILPIGRWVLRQACRQVAAWQADRAVPLTVRISVNISVKQLEDPAFVTDVGQALRDSGLSPKSLILEITETVLSQDPIAADALLKGLKQVGVQVAVDDFGVGYSSLNYLRRLPVDIVKIDRTFVGSLSGPAEMALTSAIIALSKALKLQTLAEGVERAEQAGELRALGCDSAQGYLFAKPLDAVQMEALLNSARANDNRLPQPPAQRTQKAS